MSRVNGLRLHRIAVALALIWAAGVPRVRASATHEVPLLATAPTTPSGDTDAAAARTAAIESARDAGLGWVVEDLAEETLADKNLTPAHRAKILLAVADARLQRGAHREAAQALDAITVESPEKHLRRALVAYATGNMADATSALKSAPESQLGETDKTWRAVLEGLLDCNRGDLTGGLARIDKARQKARHVTVASQILILRIRAIMMAKPAGSDPLTEIGSLLDILPDARQTYQLGKTQAFALYRMGKRNEALARLAMLPVRDRDLRAERDLLAGVIAGGRSPEGRASLLAAMDATGYKDIQRAALNALCEAILATPREEVLLQVNPVYDALTTRVDGAGGSDIADLIHLARARLMIFAATGAPDAAGAAARQKAALALEEIITKYDNSPALPEALLLSAETARGAGAFRKAAVAYEKLAGLVPAAESPDLHLLAADCYAKNRDHANAANAYANARKGLRSPAGRGAALLGEIRSQLAEGHTDEAARTLEGATGVSDEARLRAVWFVADARRTDGATAAAMRLVKNTLAGNPAPSPAVRLRFLWLRALLELGESDGAKASATAAEIAALASGSAPALPSEIRDNAPAILAQTALLRARAALVAGDSLSAISGFKALRENHPGSIAAASSYVVEGRHLAASGRHAEALEIFTEGYKRNRGAADPIVIATAHDAQFAAAIEAITLADTRGGDNLRTAFDLLDELTKDPSLAKNPDATNLFHRARLMQGDILRRLNEFDGAYKLYDDLSRSHPDHPDRLRADIARADCLLEKADTRAEFYPVAAAEYERLYNIPGRPDDLAAEAGYKRAFAVSRSPVKGSANAAANATLARREAAKLLWLQTDELLTRATKLGSRGRHWTARSLFLLSELEAKDDRTVEARAALRKLLDTNGAQPDESRRLPGAALARQTLEALSLPPAHPSPGKP